MSFLTENKDCIYRMWKFFCNKTRRWDCDSIKECAKENCTGKKVMNKDFEMRLIK